MKKLAIDFGSGTTKMYMPGCGVILYEATCIAVEEYKTQNGTSYTVKAYGDKARALFGRAAQNTRIINPVFEGDIVNENLASHLLGYFLEKVELPYRKARRTQAVFILPCGAKKELKAKYRRVAAECGLENVSFVLAPFAAVLGHNVSIPESTPQFSLDIGYSLTNMAAFSQDGIISGLNINLGGGNIDLHITDYLADTAGVKIGAATAERIKNTVGSLLHDDNKTIVIDGRDANSGAPTSISVNSGMIYDIITAYVNKTLEYVKHIISNLPPEVSSAVMRGGIYLSGGLMRMDGLAGYIGKELQMPVNLPEEPRFATVIGGGIILSDWNLFDRLATDD